MQITHFLVEMEHHTRLTLQIGKYIARERPEIDIRPDLHACRCDWFRSIAPLHHERYPRCNARILLRELHAVKQMTCLKRRIAFPQKYHVVVAPDKAHMRNARDKCLRRLDYLLLDQIGPELL